MDPWAAAVSRGVNIDRGVPPVADGSGAASGAVATNQSSALLHQQQQPPLSSGFTLPPPTMMSGVTRVVRPSWGHAPPQHQQQHQQHQYYQLIAPGMNASDGGNNAAAAAAAFAHAAAAAATAAATATATAAAAAPPQPPPPSQPSYLYGPGTSGLPMYLAAMPPALGAIPPVPSTPATMTMTEQQQSYLLLLHQQQHQQLQQQHLLQLQMQQQGGGGQQQHLQHHFQGWNPALLAPLYQMQMQQQQQRQQQQLQQQAPQFHHPQLQQVPASFVPPPAFPAFAPAASPFPFAAAPAPSAPAPPPPAPPPPPVSLDALLFASAQAAAAGDSPLATRLADAAVALSPRSAAALAALGAALHSATPSPRLDLAIFYYGSALRLCPGDGRVLNNLGAALAAAGAPAQAAGAYRASLAALCAEEEEEEEKKKGASSSKALSRSSLVPPASSSAPPLLSAAASSSSSRSAVADVAANLGDLLRSSPEALASAAAAAAAAAATGATAAPPPPPPAPPLVANGWGSFGSGLSALVASTPIFGEGGGGGAAAAPAPAPAAPAPRLPPSSLPSAPSSSPSRSFRSSSSPPPPPTPTPLPPPHLIADARSAYLRAVAAVPGHVRALTGLGDLCAEGEDAAGAAEFYGRAVAAAAADGGRGGGGGAAAGEEEKAASSSSSVAAVPAPPPPPAASASSASASRARSGLAAALRDLGRLPEAETAARAALSLDPCCPVALGVLTSALRACGDAAGAAEAAARAAAAAPPAASPEAFNALGNALREAGRPAEAVAAYSTCIRLQLSGVGGGGGFGGGTGVVAAPAMSFGAAAAVAPSAFPPPPFPPPYAAAEAAAARLAVAYSNMAAALRACGRPDEATRAFEQVALLRPADADAAAELGASLKDRGRHDEAAAAYRRALALRRARGLPGGAALAHLVHSLACVAEWRGDFPALLADLERETRAELAAASRLAEDGKPKPPPPAVQPFHAMGYPFPPELARDLSVAYADHVERTALAFVEAEEEKKKKKEKEKIKEGEEEKATAKPSPSPSSSSPQIYPFRHPPPLPLPRNARLRVAFVSSDFGNHPLSHLMAGVWKRLRAGGRVEAFLFATSPSDGSPWRRRAEAEAEHFVARPAFWEDPSPVPLATAIAEAGCHVAVNLNGYTRGARGEAFALRPAPVQASYLGFPGTLGAKRDVPWLVTDAVTSPPEEEEACYAESLARMPHCYFVNDYRAAFGSGSGSEEGGGEGEKVGGEKEKKSKSKSNGGGGGGAAAAAASAPATPPRALQLSPLPPPPPPTPPTPTRESLGLPPRPAVVFACANQLYKLDPATLRLWRRILDAVPGSVLWLLRFPPAGEARVRAAFAEAGRGSLQGSSGNSNGGSNGGETAAAQQHQQSDDGDDSRRIVFTDVAPRDVHVRRAALADVFLDTPVVNAHTTACDVLWAGVPIVTRPLRRMASRVCASLVTAAGLGAEGLLIARSEDEYVRIAVRLGLGDEGARERERLRAFLLGTRETTSALFDVDRWVRDFERLLLALWEKHAAGEEPRSFELEREEEEEVVEARREEKEKGGEEEEEKEKKKSKEKEKKK